MTPVGGYSSDLQGAGIKVYSLHMDKKLGLPFSLSRLLKIIKNEEPDVVHAQMYHANVLSRIVKLFFDSGRFYLINTIQNIFEGGSFRKLAYRYTKDIPNLVTHVSRLGCDNYIETKLIKRETALFIPNAVSLSVAEGIKPFDFRNTFQLADDTFIFLAVARLEKQKDYPTLFRAVDILRRISDKPFVVFIAGKGTLEGDLKELLFKMDLQSSIFFLGLRTDIPMLMKGADSFVMSSAWEGTPLGLLEAMSASLPAVVTDAGDNRFIVTHTVNGFVSPVGEADRLAENMKRILELLPMQLKEMALKSRQVATQNFDREAILDKWVDIYNSKK
jgi:glycosyltransferase involved in cell wall biosynthesis